MIQRRARLRADDVLERHVDDRDGDQRLDERRKPQRVGREAERGRDQRDRVRDGEGGDDEHERPQAAERDHEAGDEQQVVGAVEDVQEARLDEAQRRLVPARVEPHQARIAVELEGALGAARRQEAQRRHDLQAQPREPRVDRELATRSDAIGYSNSTSSSCWFQ